MSSKRIFSGAPWESRVGYCRALKRGEFISVSGTAPVDDKGEVFEPGNGYAQTKRCLEIIFAALAKLDAQASDVIRTRIFVTEIAHWEDIGRAHAEMFGDHPPTTTMVEVRRLISEGMLVEIEADAICEY